jgi:hypothetical protein
VAQSQVTEAAVTVSVGEPGRGPRNSGARFTPWEEMDIRDRFQAVFDLANALVANGNIDSVREYPIVRPSPEGCPIYCAFNADLVSQERQWTVVRTPDARARVALVLEIVIGERMIYWFEIEPIPRHYRAVAVEMTAGGIMDSGTLDHILTVAAKQSGVWPKTFCKASDTLLAVDAVHTNIGGELAPSVMLNAFMRLAHQRTARAASIQVEPNKSPT